MATLDDAQRVASYHHQCWLLAYEQILSAEVLQATAPRLQQWIDWLHADSDFTTVVMVDDDDRPLGHTTVNAHQLVHLFIAPENHRRGHGRQLLAVGERLIHQAGYHQAELHVRVGNVPALNLYQSSGWVLTDETVDEQLPNGSSYPEHVLRKDLAASASGSDPDADGLLREPNSK